MLSVRALSARARQSLTKGEPVEDLLTKVEAPHSLTSRVEMDRLAWNEGFQVTEGTGSGSGGSIGAASAEEARMMMVASFGNNVGKSMVDSVVELEVGLPRLSLLDLRGKGGKGWSYKNVVVTQWNQGRSTAAILVTFLKVVLFSRGC